MAAKLFFASEHVQGVAEVSTKCHREVKENIKEKGTVTKSQIFVCGGLEFFPKKFSHRENAQTIYLYINSLPKIACSVLKALSIMNVFSLTIHHSIQFPARNHVFRWLTHGQNFHSTSCDLLT